MIFDETYYRQGNYTSYLDREKRYYKTAEELSNFLKSVKLDELPFLDYGCAVGFLMSGFLNLKYEVADIHGYDV
jgi:hypothetical protein